MKKEPNIRPLLVRIRWKEICLIIVIFILLLLGLMWVISGKEERTAILPLSEENKILEEFSKTADLSQVNKKETATNDFFSTYRLDRERIRGKQLDILKAIMENKDSDDKAREMASLRMVKISEEMEKEMSLESLVKSEGIEECVALVQAGTATVIVPAGALSPERKEEMRELLFSFADFPKDKVWLKEAGKE
ncbi:SpoIIIAH-like family protein [Syntrophomonas wolfei]|jgi:stage III sporulation protein AH|uniref:SpoIIIAH-like family protein n=1 Tax=Syntrophomonas wolfei TaxID=863 RepID=A0A354Z0T4_9FIRM|nr:SpoIIIAH-like family protein [Syntrophomonas wolfei]HBK54571.1 SpoIIIAH-like family protein [Syntrophomonas wolfei]